MTEVLQNVKVFPRGRSRRRSRRRRRRRHHRRRRRRRQGYDNTSTYSSKTAELNMSKQPPPGQASAKGHCRLLSKLEGRPGAESLPSTIAPPDLPPKSMELTKILGLRCLVKPALVSLGLLSPFRSMLYEADGFAYGASSLRITLLQMKWQHSFIFSVFCFSKDSAFFFQK